MYGLVNKAIQELVCSRFGEETWRQIKQKAEISTDTFLSMEGYPDDLTHRLVVAASQVLGISTVGINFPKLVPPSFECHEVEENQLELHYHSSREGLAPMVTGLVKGLGQKFDTEVKVTQTTSREQGSEHDTFVIEYKPN